MTDRNHKVPFRFTDAEWRAYQRLPDQGMSHRHWLESVVSRRTPSRVAPTREQLEVALDRAHTESWDDAAECDAYEIQAADAVLALLAEQPTVAQVKTQTFEEASHKASNDPELNLEDRIRVGTWCAHQARLARERG